MSSYGLGDIVLINFPYTNLGQSKKRPALVLLDTQDGDVVVCRITSQSRGTVYDVDIHDWQQAGLKLSSTIRLHKVATLEKKLISIQLGKLTQNDLSSVKKTIKNIVVTV